MSAIRFLFRVGLATTVIEAATKFAKSILLASFRKTPDNIPFAANILFAVQNWLVASVIVIVAYVSTPVPL